MNNAILVTGSTGNVGKEIIRALANGNRRIKAAVTDETSTTKLGTNTETVVLDFEKPQTFTQALQDVSSVFLMRPPQMGDPSQLYPFIDACKANNITHMVFLSLLGIQYNPFAPHGYIEKHIKKSGIPYTLLRPSFFMQNLSTTHAHDIREHNEVYVPAGKGKTSFIDARDIAAVAAKVLTEDGHSNKAYDLTGAEALSYFQVAEILSYTTGRTIVYANPSAKDFGTRMQQEGLGADFISVMKNIYLINKIGLAGKVTNTVQEILGRKPITFTQFTEDNKQVFMPVTQ